MVGRVMRWIVIALILSAIIVAATVALIRPRGACRPDTGPTVKTFAPDICEVRE